MSELELCRKETEVSLDDTEEDESFKTKSAWRKERKKDRTSRTVSVGSSSESFSESDYHLHFPRNCNLSLRDKKDWYMAHFPVGVGSTLVRGENRVFIACKKKEDYERFLKNEYGGIRLEGPKKPKETKIIIKNVPLYEDPDVFLETDYVLWARRVVKAGYPVKEVIAGITGPIPGQIEDCPGEHCAKKFYVIPYIPEPDLCYRCSKWGHFQYQCMGAFHCRYCAGSHDSRICGDKIKQGVQVPRKCANCLDNHNANSILCKLRPGYDPKSEKVKQKVNVTERIQNQKDVVVMNKKLVAVKGPSINVQSDWPARHHIDHSTPSQTYANASKNPWGDFDKNVGVHIKNIRNKQAEWSIIEDTSVENMNNGRNAILNNNSGNSDEIEKGMEEQSNKSESGGMKSMERRIMMKFDEMRDRSEHDRRENEKLREKVKELEILVKGKKVKDNRDVNDSNISNEDKENEVGKVSADVFRNSIMPRGMTERNVKSHLDFLESNGQENRAKKIREIIFKIRSLGENLSEEIDSDVLKYGDRDQRR